MSAQKNTLAALLAATVIIAPAVAEAKPGKDRGAEDAGKDHKRGGGGGGEKHRQAWQPAQAAPQPAFAPSQQVLADRGDNRKQMRQERKGRAERFAAELRQQQAPGKPPRWEREAERQAKRQRAERFVVADRPERVARATRAAVAERGWQPEARISRKAEKQLARQQKEIGRAIARQQRQWGGERRQALRQVVAAVPVAVPVAVYQPAFAEGWGAPRYTAQPVYVAPAVATYGDWARYAPAAPYGYAYPAAYAGTPAYADGSWPYSQGYDPYPSDAGYAPYDAGYGSAGLGGLFGGGGGFGEIIAALLPLLLGDSLGLGGLGGGLLGGGLLDGALSGGAIPGLGGELGAAPVGYAEPAYAYQDAPFGETLPGGLDQGLLGGGDGLMSLLPLVLQSGLFGGGSDSLGGLADLGGALGLGTGLGDGLGLANSDFAYAAPYVPGGELPSFPI
jgi:hypothetical protein